jgi:hypothetical protein
MRIMKILLNKKKQLTAAFFYEVYPFKSYNLFRVQIPVWFVSPQKHCHRI